MRAFPPRLHEQPIFYPVLTESYAIKIARDWNVRADGAGFVTRFLVSKRHMDQIRGARSWRQYPPRILDTRRRTRRLQCCNRRPDRGRASIPLRAGPNRAFVQKS
jgi:hypothetical protein